MPKLLIIDGYNLLYRAYYATEDKMMLSPQGGDVNAIYTAISMIRKYIDDFKPDYVVVASDAGSNTFRHQNYQDYKATRSATPDRLKSQFELAKELYAKMGIKLIEHEGYEADDIIATLAKNATAANIQTQVVSSDKDLLQILSDSVSVFCPKRVAFGKDINYTPEVFKDKYNVDVDEWVLYKSLIGDSSDNIIGVPKIGPKTAVSLINQYHTVDNLLTAAREEKLKPAQNKNINAASEQIKDNIKLVTLVDDVDLGIDITDLKFNGYQNPELLTFLKQHGMRRHLATFSKLIDHDQTPISADFKILDQFDPDLICGINFIYTQSLGENYFLTPSLGFGIYNEKGLYYLGMDQVDEKFIAFLQDDSQKVTFDLKRLMAILKLKTVGNFIMDIKIANALLASENYKKDFDFIALENKVDGVYSFSEIYESKTKPVFDIDKIRVDMVTKAKALSKLFLIIANKLEIDELDKVYYDIEHPLIGVLARMEICGILIDTTALEQLEKDYEDKLNQVRNDISKITDISVDSPKQLRDFIFITLGVNPKGCKKTQSGYSTDQETLTYLLQTDLDDRAHKFISLVLEYRKLSKIYKTYIKGLQKYLIGDHLHPIYQQLLSETGRITATEPNIQNIPIRTEEGSIIRTIFTAPSDDKFVSCDYSQVELRVIAQLSQETNMLLAFNNEEDIHAQTAKRVLGKEKVTPGERARAKAINFGIIYGISPYGLAKQIESSVGEAKEFIQAYLHNYPNILKYQEEAVKEAFEQGFTKTLFNRRRYINADVSKANELEAIKRICINTPIQGTAADIIKLAMIEVDKYLLATGEGEMVMQIHDELVFYLPQAQAEQMCNQIKTIMENIVDFDVTLKVDGSIGENWKETK